MESEEESEEASEEEGTTGSEGSKSEEEIEVKSPLDIYIDIVGEFCF